MCTVADSLSLEVDLEVMEVVVEDTVDLVPPTEEGDTIDRPTKLPLLDSRSVQVDIRQYHTINLMK